MVGEEQAVNKNSEFKFLLKHSSVYGLGRVVGQVLSFLLLPLYTRYLTPADYGVMSLVDITNGIMALVLGMSITSALSRFYYEYDNEKKQFLVVSSNYIFMFFLCLVSAPFIFAIAPSLSQLIFQTSDLNSVFRVSLMAMLLGLLSDVGMTFLRIRAESIRFVTITFVRMFVTISCNILFVVYLETGVIGIFYSSFVSNVLLSLFLSIIIFRKTGFGFSFGITKEMIKYSFPMVFTQVFRILVNESDKFFINYFFSPMETGIYSIAQKVGTAIHAILTSPFLQAYLPRKFQIMKRADAKEIYASVLDFYLVFVCSAGVAIAVFSDEILILMTTEDFFGAAQYIPWIVCSMVIFGMKYHFETGIMIVKKTKYLAYSNGVSTALNILLNLYLIPRYKIWGAIIAINFSYAIIIFLNYYWSQKEYFIRFHFIRVVRILALSLIVYYFSTFLTVSISVCALIIKGGVVALYIGFLFWFESDIRNIIDLNQAIKKRR